MAVSSSIVAQQPAATGALPEERPAFHILPSTAVCIVVHMDQHVWPTPLTGETPAALSGLLADTLGRLYSARHGSHALPGTDGQQRFAVNSRGDHPSCRQADRAIHITLNYRPRPDGGPFVVHYLIRQGRLHRSGSFARDIRGELAAGTLPNVSINEPIQLAVADDLRARASFLLAQLETQP